MKLVFLGTKGEIEESTPKHKYHSSLLIISKEAKLLVDYGMLRKYSLEKIQPDAILITHAHPDHYNYLYSFIFEPLVLTRQYLRIQ